MSGHRQVCMLCLLLLLLLDGSDRRAPIGCERLIIYGRKEVVRNVLELGLGVGGLSSCC